MHSRLTIKGYIILSNLMQSRIYDKLYDVSLKFSKTDSFPVIYFEIGEALVSVMIFKVCMV